ncbi:unnamed protein product [Callosobruchus maculatus]|uniref:BESS domain-containing protein n=1 Tax=Callosobruchus maculatus TaxID=64391 RepID=A0A653DBY8_CALMS|nr:unnamed protein product [Callosobruchus maculatus]
MSSHSRNVLELGASHAFRPWLQCSEESSIVEDTHLHGAAIPQAWSVPKRKETALSYHCMHIVGASELEEVDEQDTSGTETTQMSRGSQAPRASGSQQQKSPLPPSSTSETNKSESSLKPPLPHPAKRSKKKTQAQMVEEAYGVMTKLKQGSEDDEFDAFGKHVAFQIRNLGARFYQARAKHKINELLFNLEMEVVNATRPPYSPCSSSSACSSNFNSPLFLETSSNDSHQQLQISTGTITTDMPNDDPTDQFINTLLNRTNHSKSLLVMRKKFFTLPSHLNSPERGSRSSSWRSCNKSPPLYTVLALSDGFTQNLLPFRLVAAKMTNAAAARATSDSRTIVWCTGQDKMADKSQMQLSFPQGADFKFFADVNPIADVWSMMGRRLPAVFMLLGIRLKFDGCSSPKLPVLHRLCPNTTVEHQDMMMQ